MNYDLLKISNENTLQKLYVKYTEVFKKENIEEKKEEDKSMKRKFDKITEIDEQIQEINPIKELKLSSDIEEELSQELINIKLNVEKKNDKSYL